MERKSYKNRFDEEKFVKRKNSAGFTLVELLSVLIILISIMSLSIVSISSALENTNSSEDENLKNVWLAAAELYVTDNKQAIFDNIGSRTTCYISLDTLVSSGYLTTSQITNSDDELQSGYIIFKKGDITYEYKTSSSGVACLN